MFRVLIVLMAILATTPAKAADSKDYDYCEIGGYYMAAGDKFLAGLAQRMLIKKGLMGDSVCSAAWKSAYDASEEVSRTGKVKESQKPILKKALAFGTRVNDAVLKLAGYE